MALSDRDGQIWFDGSLVPWREAKIHVLTHALHYGTSIFEGVRCYAQPNGKAAIFRLPEHTHRLFMSARIIGMKIPFSPETITKAHGEVVNANGLSSCYIRPLAFYGAHSLGLGCCRDNPVHVIIAAWPWGPYLGEEALQKGVRIKTSSYTRLHVNASMCRAKVGGHYVNSVLAHEEATHDGYDEALLLDANGLVTEGSGENIFLVYRGTIYTPSLTSVLEGITRDSVITLAADLGFEVKEASITRDFLYSADEAFFTGTAVEVAPIREVDNRLIGKGQRGPVTERLQKAFFDTVAGHGKRASEWLTNV